MRKPKKMTALEAIRNAQVIINVFLIGMEQTCPII